MKKAVFFFILMVSVLSCNATDAWKKDREGFVDPEKVRAAAEVKPHPRQLAWQQLELTCFFHFGINTFTDVEWGDGTEDPKLFNPTELDCHQWVKAVKAAGFKLAILTAKHHDGFCLWPSKYTTHDVASSSYKNGKGDVVKEFVDACRAEGIKIGIYLSPWDRHEPTYGTDAYNDYFDNQINEIFDLYGPDIDEFWFDGANGEGPNGKIQVYDWTRFYKTRRGNRNGAWFRQRPGIRTISPLHLKKEAFIMKILPPKKWKHWVLLRMTMMPRPNIWGTASPFRQRKKRFGILPSAILPFGRVGFTMIIRIFR